jgi:hypothetical protein
LTELFFLSAASEDRTKIAAACAYPDTDEDGFESWAAANNGDAVTFRPAAAAGTSVLPSDNADAPRRSAAVASSSSPRSPDGGVQVQVANNSSSQIASEDQEESKIRQQRGLYVNSSVIVFLLLVSFEDIDFTMRCHFEGKYTVAGHYTCSLTVRMRLNYANGLLSFLEHQCLQCRIFVLNECDRVSQYYLMQSTKMMGHLSDGTRHIISYRSSACRPNSTHSAG